MIEIKNDHLTASISPLGAELQSLKLNHNQHELIWQRDPEVWSGSAPILFPIAGRQSRRCRNRTHTTLLMKKENVAWNIL